MDDLDLRDLTALMSVARHRSFRRAASELGVSVSGVSQRLRDLEARLGVRLLNRTTRSVAPTEAGARFLAQLAPALQGVADAVTDLRRTSAVPSGRLRINAPAPALHLTLAPMLAAFCTRYPAIELDIVAETNLIDIVGAEYDAGVRWGEDLAQDMIAVPLGGPERYVVAGSPAYFAKNPKPLVPGDLLQHTCLSIRFPNRRGQPWEFGKDGHVVQVTPPCPLTSNDPAALLRAALDGLGLVTTFEGYVADAIAAGTLVPVLADWCQPFPGPFLYYPSRRQPPAALAAFVGFVGAWRKQG